MEDNNSHIKGLNLQSYSKVISFLLLEILAVISFSLGNSFIFYAVLSIVILLLIILITFKEIKFDGVSNIAMFLFPLVIFGILSALSYLRYDPYYVLGNSPILMFIPIGLVCFAASGYFINLTGKFNIKYALLVIYSAIGLLTFLNLVVTMIQFVPFYSLRYSNYYYYYNGQPSSSPIGDMGYFLMGFSFQEVSLSYFWFYPIILLTAFLPLFHMKFKENKKLYIAYLCFGILGLITLILTINLFLVVILIGISIIIGLIIIQDKIGINKKVWKYGGIVLLVLFAVGLIFITLNAQESVGTRINFIRNFTTGNALLNRLFNENRIIASYNSILDGLFASTVIDGSKVILKLFGFPINGGYLSLFGNMYWPLKDSNSFLFDSIFESGLFGTLFLIVVLALSIRRVIMYYNNSDDNKEDKVLILGFVVVSLIYSLINFDATPMIFSKQVTPFYLNNIFMIDLFLFGYCYFKSEKKIEKVEEVKTDEAQL